MSAVIWHDTHVDPAVYLFDSEAEAQEWFKAALIDYLRGYDPVEWDERHAYAARLETMEPADVWRSFTHGEHFIEKLDAWIVEPGEPWEADDE